MSDIVVTGPDGSTFSFPEGTTQDIIDGALHQHYGSTSQAAPMSGGTKAARMVGQAATGANDALYGTVLSPLDISGWLAKKTGLLDLKRSLLGEPSTEAQPPIPPSRAATDTLAKGAILAGQAAGVVSPDAQPRFEPQGTAEKTAYGVGNGVGNALAVAIPAGAVAGVTKAGTLTNGVANALSSQPVLQAASGAAQGGVTEGTGNPWLGVAAGAAVPIGYSVTQRLISPVSSSLTPQEQTIVQTADKEGIPLTPAQRTGDRTLRFVEEKMAKLPGSAGPIGDMFAEQHGQFNRAALERAGVTATDVSPATMDAAFQRAGQTFDDLASRTTLNVDPQLASDIQNVVQKYGRRLEGNVAPVFNSYVEDLTKAIAPPPGAGPAAIPQIPGDIYKNIRSDIGGTIRSNGKNPDLQNALRGLQNALDDAVERSTSGPLRTEWQDARRQYQALMTIDQAARSGTQVTRSAGDIPYAGLTNAVRSSDRAGFARGRGQLNALSRVGDYIAQRTPDSGTPGGEAILNPLKWPTLAGLNVAGRAYRTAPVQAYLTNQVAGTTNIRNALAAQAARELLNSNEANLARGGR